MTDNIGRTRVGWRIWIWWVLASIVGLAVAFAEGGAQAFLLQITTGQPAMP